MINVFTLRNINTKISEGKLSKIFISEVCIKLVALRMMLYQEVAHSFRKVGDPWFRASLFGAISDASSTHLGRFGTRPGSASRRIHRWSPTRALATLRSGRGNRTRLRGMRVLRFWIATISISSVVCGVKTMNRATYQEITFALNY